MEIKCLKCNEKIIEKPKLSLLAFEKYKCKKCGNINLYPLNRGYKIFYWILLIGAFGHSINIIQEGGIPLPGILVIGATIALIKDYSIRKNLS